MRNLFKALSALIVTLSIMLLTYVSPLAVTYEYSTNHQIFQHNSASVYFANLETNFARNENDTCAYVALAMLLSYYDAYLSDDFISSEYEVKGSFNYDEENDTVHIFNSPGIYQEPVFDLAGLYDMFVDAYADEYFQFLLIQLRSEISFPNQDTNDTNYKYSITPDETYILLLYYLYIIQDFNTSLFYSNYMRNVENIPQNDGIDDNADYYTTEQVRAQLIENIKNGIPTIYFGYPGPYAGHCMIAYDYDENNDEIYFHTGWIDDEDTVENERIAKESDLVFDDRITIIWLELHDGYEHACSNSYVNSTTNEEICMCRFAFHPDHTHTPTNEYLSYTTSSHVLACQYCNNGYVTTHTPTYRWFSSTQHISTCPCGRTIKEAHIKKRGENTCISCGVTVDDGFVILSNRPSNEPLNASTLFSDEHTYITPGGIVVLSNSDYFEYINGALTLEEIYKKVGIVYD